MKDTENGSTNIYDEATTSDRFEMKFYLLFILKTSECQHRVYLMDQIYLKFYVEDTKSDRLEVLLNLSEV